MQLKTRVIGAAGIAAVVAAGGFAFTDTNTVPTAKHLGYGETSAAGVTTTAVAYHITTADSSKIDSVTYTADADVVAGLAPQLLTVELKLGSATVPITNGTSGTCTQAVSPATAMVCAFTPSVDMSAFNKVALVLK